MDRTERQKLGISRWIKCGGNGVLNWSTGVGNKCRSLEEFNELLSGKIEEPCDGNIEVNS